MHQEGEGRARTANCKSYDSGPPTVPSITGGILRVLNRIRDPFKTGRSLKFLLSAAIRYQNRS